MNKSELKRHDNIGQCVIVTLLVAGFVFLLNGKENEIRVRKSVAKDEVSKSSADSPDTRLLTYAERGETSYVEKLLLENPTLDVNRPRAEGNKTALYMACQKGYSDIARLLLKRNADMMICDTEPKSLRDAMKYSPLTIAARNGHVDIVKLFWDAGVSLESRDAMARTALWTAAAHNQLAVVQFLCGAGASANSCVSDKRTPLFAAIQYGNVEVVRALLKHGVEVNSGKCGSEKTALYVAVSYNNPEIVRLLCEAGADLEAKSKWGADSWVTPVEAASRLGYENVVRVLSEFVEQGGGDTKGRV